jgi:ribosome biogenesis protein SSF1/2
MNGLTTGEEHLKLIAVVFQNIVPPINVNTVKLSTCQRVLLLNYDKKTKCIDFRHYSVSAQPVGVTRNIRKLVQRKKLPDLSKLSDVSEFVNKTGYGSESEAEDEAAKVELADEFGKGNHASQRSAVKLHEIGPRMTLQLVKVEEGLCDGAVMFHEFVKKTPEEILALRNSKEQREALRKQRRAEQEANVKKKEEERNSKKKRKFVAEDKPAGEDYDVVADDDLSDADEEGPAVGAGGVDKDDMEDADWYRQEVGEEPDEGFMAGQSSSRRPPSKYNAHFGKRRDSDRKGKDDRKGKESGGQNRKERPPRSAEKRVERKPGGNFGKSFEKKSFGGKSNRQKGEGQDKFSRNRSGGRGDKDGRPSKKRKH